MISGIRPGVAPAIERRRMTSPVGFAPKQIVAAASIETANFAGQKAVLEC